MAGRKAERHVRSKRLIPYIPPSDASRILERCEQILEGSRELLTNLRSVGIAELFARLDDSVLQLAIQPDSGRAHQGATNVGSCPRLKRND
jgi:hypothetical protein